ncbi:hypothetical protein ABZ705_31805 [Streptomyces sp. NPDC006984]|uniref:hypothetical protein n=1 Tax=Streptomyces sp. NPDC006984 TaxID=3155463 RepID=UPI0033C96C4B
MTLRTRPRPRGGRRAPGTGALALTGAALLLAGCGIRPTQVPVDAGPAPSRAACEVPEEAAPETAPGGTRRVYLLCTTGLVPVARSTAVAGEPAGGRVAAAQSLVDALLRVPSEAETAAGLSSQVRGPLVVGDARAGDPSGTLRLSRQPEDLPVEALAQLVCTLAESGAAVDSAVVLGGPGPYGPHAYTCPSTVRERPESPLPTRAVPTPGPR